MIEASGKPLCLTTGAGLPRAEDSARALRCYERACVSNGYFCIHATESGPGPKGQSFGVASKLDSKVFWADSLIHQAKSPQILNNHGSSASDLHSRCPC